MSAFTVVVSLSSRSSSILKFRKKKKNSNQLFNSEIIRIISFPEGGRKTTFHDVIYKFHHKKNEHGQIDITDLKEIPDDEDNDLDVLLYKATIPN